MAQTKSTAHLQSLPKIVPRRHFCMTSEATATIGLPHPPSEKFLRTPSELQVWLGIQRTDVHVGSSPVYCWNSNFTIFLQTHQSYSFDVLCRLLSWLFREFSPRSLLRKVVLDPSQNERSILVRRLKLFSIFWNLSWPLTPYGSSLLDDHKAQPPSSQFVPYWLTSHNDTGFDTTNSDPVQRRIQCKD